jgi:hypothetical protein
MRFRSGGLCDHQCQTSGVERIIGLIGIFTWWQPCVEATMTVGNMLIAVYAGSMVYKDARPQFADAGSAD